jgi:hypothetical protein
MYRFTKPFFGVAPGDVYPREFGIGETCPDELVEAATESEAIEAVEAIVTGADDKLPADKPDPSLRDGAKSRGGAPENKAQS